MFRRVKRGKGDFMRLFRWVKWLLANCIVNNINTKSELGQLRNIQN